MDEAKRQRILKEYGLDKPPPGQEAWWAFVEQADLSRLVRAMKKVPDPEQIRADTLRGAVRRVLKARGLPLSPKQDAYLDNYDDLEELGGWLNKAATVASADEMFPWIERDPASSETRLTEARRALRSVIRVRGLTLAPEEDKHIERCEELDVLRDWLDRTVTATSMKEVFRWFEDNPRMRR